MPIQPTSTLVSRLRKAVSRKRLLDTALNLISVYSPTGSARDVLDCLADILQKDGFTVQRPEGGHATAPAVAVRWMTPLPGPVVQFNGHLDTVHLPFVPPSVDGDLLRGSGSSDMKGGVAAMVEALRVLGETNALPCGGILLTAHDLHETPWGDGSQLERMIDAGFVGDAVLLPEYLWDRLPVIGRGGLVWKATLRRQHPPVHEVFRPRNLPEVSLAAADIIQRLPKLARALAKKSDRLAGFESVFLGQVHAGEIFNQSPQECRLEGTLRWLPGTDYRKLLSRLEAVVNHPTAAMKGISVQCEYQLLREAFRLEIKDPFVEAFQQAHQAVAGKRLKKGAKPFCDDGNTFWARADIPAITHGPRAGGAHTLAEWASIDDLCRVALEYALTAVLYCEQRRDQRKRNKST